MGAPIGSQRYDGHALLLGLLQEFARLRGVYEQVSRPRLFVLKVFRPHLLAFSNVDIVQGARPTILGRPHVAVPQIEFAIANALDFGAQQTDPRFNRIQYFVIAIGDAVDRDDLARWFFLFGAALGQKETGGRWSTNALNLLLLLFLLLHPSDPTELVKRGSRPHKGLHCDDEIATNGYWEVVWWWCDAHHSTVE